MKEKVSRFKRKISIGGYVESKSPIAFSVITLI